MTKMSSSSRAANRRGPGALKRLWPLAPAFIWLTLFCVAPLALIVLYSVGHRLEGGQVALGFTAEHYVRFLRSPFYWGVLVRSLSIGVSVTVVALLIGYPVAYLFAGATQRMRPILLAALIVPWWCNILVKNFAWIALLGEKGIVNAQLLRWGLIDRALPLIYNEAAVVLGLVHVLLPFMVLPIFSSLERIDHRLIEAAQNLGGNSLRTFAEITLPLSMPGVFAGSVLCFVLAFGSYITPALLGSERTVMVSQIIEDQFLTSFHWPFGAAIAIILLCIVVGLLAVLSRMVNLDRVWGATQ
jgi:ABC-type spermidine/putrescine transport system permease subunit I